MTVWTILGAAAIAVETFGLVVMTGGVWGEWRYYDDGGLVLAGGAAVLGGAFAAWLIAILSTVLGSL